MTTETNTPDVTPDLASTDASTPLSCADPRHRLPDWLENAWLERYLLRQLDSAEQVWFETYVLQWPELADALEADAALRSALAALPVSAFEESTADDPVVPPPAVQAPQARRRWTRYVRPLGTLAAGFMMAVLTAPLLLPEMPTAIGNPTRVVYDIVRGEPAAPHVEVGDTASAYVIVEIAMPPDALGVELSIGEPGHSRVLLQSLMPSTEGFATALLSRAVFSKAHATVLLKNGERRPVNLSLGSSTK